MATPKEIIAAVWRLRKDILAIRGHGGRKGTLRYQCDRIANLPIDGQDWSSWDMPDPLNPTEKGHCVRIVPDSGSAGWVVSLTGRTILGKVSDMGNEDQTRAELEAITGATRWIRKTTNRRV